MTDAATVKAAMDAAHAKATEGEWREFSTGIGTVYAATSFVINVPDEYYWFENQHDAASIVALHNGWPVVSAWIDQLLAERDAAVARERAAVLKWLKDEAADCDLHECYREGQALDDAADAIEAGRHREGE